MPTHVAYKRLKLMHGKGDAVPIAGGIAEGQSKYKLAWRCDRVCDVAQ
jgi:hypothetical protein